MPLFSVWPWWSNLTISSHLYTHFAPNVEQIQCIYSTLKGFNGTLGCIDLYSEQSDHLLKILLMYTHSFCDSICDFLWCVCTAPQLDVCQQNAAMYSYFCFSAQIIDWLSEVRIGMIPNKILQCIKKRKWYTILSILLSFVKR